MTSDKITQPSHKNHSPKS